MSSILPAPAFAPALSVVSPALDSHRLPIAAQIRLATGAHAIAQLTILTPVAADRQALEQSVPSSMIIADGTPVHFTYSSSNADGYSFYGYIASHRKLSTQGASRVAGMVTLPVQYTLTGSSMPMQNAVSRSFLNTSASSIARQIATANQLAAYVTVSPRTFPAKIQAAVSDFSFLQDLAAQVGFECWVDNSLLYFVDPAVSIDPAGSGAPLLRRDMAPGVWDSLSAFEATVGETDPSGSYLTSYTASTLRSASGQLATASAVPVRVSPGKSSAPAFGRVVKGRIASSYAEAQAVANAAMSTQRYWVSATATCDGDTRLRPGRTVSLAGNALPGADQGAWRICQATHRISLDPLLRAHNTYFVDLELGRDQEDSLNLTTPRPVAPEPGAMVLSGSAWRALSYGGGT